MIKPKLIYPTRCKSWFHKKWRGRPATAFIWNDTFDDGVLVLFGVDTEGLHREYGRYNRDPELTKELMGDMKEGWFLYHNKVSGMAFRDEKPKVGIIAHEVVHFVTALSDERGINHDRNNDETQAYLTGWLVDRIYNLSRKGNFGL